MMFRAFSMMFLLAGPLSAATPVTVAPLASLVTYPEQSAPATVQALNSPAVAAQISARIETIQVQVGDRVEAGDLLAALDCRDYQSRLVSARAELGRLQSQRRFSAGQLRRASDLKSKNSISEELVDQRRTELAAADAGIAAQRELIRQAEWQVERCEVRAPFAAIIVDRLASVGALAMPGTQLLQLTQLDGAEVSAALRPSETDSLRASDATRFRFEGRDYPVALRVLPPLIDTVRRTREARLRFSAEMAPIGAAGRLLWRDPRPHIPAEYLVRRDGRLGLFLLTDGQASFQPVAGALEGRPAALELDQQTLVIVEGREGLADGQAVASESPSATTQTTANE